MQMVNLAVYEALGSSWEYVDETQGVLLAREHRILPVVVGDVLYILIAQGPDSRLLAWDQRTRWRSVPLGQALDGSLPLAALNVHGRLTLLAASPPAAPEQATQPSQPASDRLQVSLHTLAIAEEGFTSQTIRLAGSPLLWSADALPTAAVLADQIALLWQEQGQTRMGYCDLSGEIPAVHDSDAFAGPDRGNGDLYLQIFRYLLLAGAFTMMFLMRPRTLPKPFGLPPSQGPAPIASRFLAGLLDFLPFMFLASGAYLVLLPPGTNVDQHARQIMEGTVLPDALAWCVISGMTGFLLYSTLMEFYFQATLGKMLFRLRVVGDEGRKPSLREVAARNLMKVIALSFSLFLLGIYALFMLLTRMRQGLGDMVARTTVTTEVRPGPVSPKPPEPDDDQVD
ncbi:MAG: RDD family protein [Planctomycetes bacterium ADurb.Bin126]|nr:MAG: RDD family protein [Planctomycetes bacterium ADurb.Bin126]